MIKRKEIAVIMCIYRSDDVKAFISAADSILKQTVPCELLIYQDGLISDELSEELSKYEKYDFVKVFRSEINKGLAFGLNHLINFALEERYSFIARMDSDDISYPERIEKQLIHFTLNTEVDVLGTSCREFGASYALNEKHLPQQHEQLLNFSITRCPFIHPTVMFRASVFEKGYGYPENTTLTEDMALWFELLNAGFKFANINEVLLDYRLNENTINRRKGFKKALSEITIRLKNMKSLRQVSLINIGLIGARIVFHLMPVFLMKLAYKKTR